MQRRQQGAAFTPDAMDAYLPRVVATCEAYLQQWASQDSINLVPAVSVPSSCQQHVRKGCCAAGWHMPGPLVVLADCASWDFHGQIWGCRQGQKQCRLTGKCKGRATTHWGSE